jgi:hypothetical protein
MIQSMPAWPLKKDGEDEANFVVSSAEQPTLIKPGILYNGEKTSFRDYGQ